MSTVYESISKMKIKKYYTYTHISTLNTKDRTNTIKN